MAERIKQWFFSSAIGFIGGFVLSLVLALIAINLLGFEGSLMVPLIGGAIGCSYAGVYAKIKASRNRSARG